MIQRLNGNIKEIKKNGIDKISIIESLFDKSFCRAINLLNFLLFWHFLLPQAKIFL
jgi:hypothetical protein